MVDFGKGFVAAAAFALVTMPAPALAAVDPIYGGDNPAADEACDAVLKVNDNSGFTTYAESVSAGSTSSQTVDDPNGVVTIAGIGSPSYTISNYRDAHQNGQSVNIHAYGDKVTSYAAGALKTIPTIRTDTTTYNVTCHVHKETSGNDRDPDHEGYNVPPPGLNAQVSSASYTETTTTPGIRTENIPGPWIDPNASEIGAQFVICISPNRNPGAWRSQNGYTNQIDGRTCSTAWYQDLGATTPSVSVPQN